MSDGVADCKSGSDECISVDSVFSDQKSMISSKIVLAFVWIISEYLLDLAASGVVYLVCVERYPGPTERQMGHIAFLKL